MTKWHEILGQQLRLLLTPLNLTVQTSLEVLSSPPEADILILRTNQKHWTAAQRACLPDGIRDSFAPQVLIEFKFSESLTEHHLMKVQGYEAFYRESQSLKAEQLQSFVLSSKTPQASFRERYGYQPTAKAGVYHSDNVLLSRIPLITLNELADTPHNAYVKCFASRASERRRAFAQLGQLGLAEVSGQLWFFLLGLRKTMNVEGDAKIMQNVQLTPEDVARLGEELGTQWLTLLSVEERLQGLEPEERLRGLEPEELLSYHKPMKQYLNEREKTLLVQGIQRSLRIRFNLTKNQLEGYQQRLQKLTLKTLDQLSETALLVADERSFEQTLQEAETSTTPS